MLLQKDQVVVGMLIRSLCDVSNKTDSSNEAIRFRAVQY
jgi:hypothetical protein